MVPLVVERCAMFLVLSVFVSPIYAEKFIGGVLSHKSHKYIKENIIVHARDHMVPHVVERCAMF